MEMRRKWEMIFFAVAVDLFRDKAAVINCLGNFRQRPK